MSSSQDGGVNTPNVRLTSEFKSFKGLSKIILSQRHSSKLEKGKGSSSCRFVSVEDDVIDEGYRSSLRKAGLKSSNPSVQGANKVGGCAPTEGDSS